MKALLFLGMALVAQAATATKIDVRMRVDEGPIGAFSLDLEDPAKSQTVTHGDVKVTFTAVPEKNDVVLIMAKVEESGGARTLANMRVKCHLEQTAELAQTVRGNRRVSLSVTPSKSAE